MLTICLFASSEATIYAFTFRRGGLYSQIIYEYCYTIHYLRPSLSDFITFRITRNARQPLITLKNKL